MHMRPSSGILESRHDPRSLISLQGRKNLPLSELKGKKVLSVSAIGNPTAFEHTLTQLGAQLVATMRLADHTGRSDQVRKWLKRNRRHAEWVVMTENGCHALGSRWRTPSARLCLTHGNDFQRGEEHWQKTDSSD
jgi:tetraacyldisaccharide-1-P 4'-kinase